MRQLCHFNPAERQQEKARARAADDLALQSGEVSRDELRARNGFFSSLEIVSSSVRRRGVIA